MIYPNAGLGKDSFHRRIGLSLMFAVLADASAAWRGVKITFAVSRLLADLRKNFGNTGAVQAAA